uniref:Polyprotein n=1 Tax=Suillus luteus endornavirus 1 TaxID=3067806 RepID=A0AA49XCQ7_9VIRU|nr:polyprotein [Suillus luteus endornavirus 1]
MEKLIKLFSKTRKQDHQNLLPDEDGDLLLSQAAMIQNQNANSGYTDKSMVFMDTKCWRYLASHFRILMESTDSEYVLDSYTDREKDFESWKSKKYNLYLNKRLYMETLKTSGEEAAMEAVFREMTDPIKTASIRFLLPNSPLWTSLDFICLDNEVHLISARVLYTTVVQYIPDHVTTPSLFKTEHYYHIDNKCQTLASELKEKLIIAMGKKTHTVKLTMSNKGILINGLDVKQHQTQLQMTSLLTIPMVGINMEDMISMLNLDKNPGFRKRIITHDERIVGTALSRVYYNIINTPRPSDKPPTEGVFSNVDMNYIEDLDDENFKHTLLMLSYQVIVSNKAENVELSPMMVKLLANQDWTSTKRMVNYSSHYVMLAWENMPSAQYDYIHVVGFEVSNATVANLGYNEMGHQFINNGILYVSPYNSNRTYAYTSYSKSAFTQGDDWILNGIKYCKFNHKSYNYGACISYTSKNFYEISKEPNNEWAMLSIPYISPDLLTTAGIPHVTIKKSMLNKQLLNDMLARNLYGQMTYEGLVEYGLSLSYIKYYRGSLPVNVKEIDTEMIRCHAYVAYVLQQRNELATNAIITAITGGPLNRIALAMTSGMVKFFFSQFSLNLNEQSMYKKIFKNLTEGLNIETKARSLLSYWTNLDTFASSSDNFILEEHGNKDCKHHSSVSCDGELTRIECPCCHCLTGETQLERFCYHCSIGTQLPMDLESDLKPIELTDSKATFEPITQKEQNFDIYNFAELIEGDEELRETVEEDVTSVNEEELNKLLERESGIEVENQTTTNYSANNDQQEDNEQFENTLTESDISEALSWPSEESIFVDLDEMKPWVGVERIELLKENKLALNLHKKLSSLYFLPHGSYSEDVAKYTIIKSQKMPEQSCGKAVLKYYLGMNLSEQWFQDTINCNEPMTMAHLSACFEKFYLNHGFVVGKNLIFKTVVDSSLYCIVEYEPRDNLTGHWNAIQIEQIESNDGLYLVPFKTTEQYKRIAEDVFKKSYKSLTLEQQLYVNKLLCNTIQMTDCIYPNLPRITDNKYGNSNYNYIRSGNFSLDLNTTGFANEFKSFVEGGITENEFLGYSDFTETAPIIDKLKQLLKICLVNIYKASNDNMEYKQMVSLEVYSSGQQVIADVSNTKLKSGDIVKLTDGTTQMLTVITVINNQLILPTKHMNPATATINVKIPKTSIGSAVRKALSILRVLRNLKLIDIAVKLLEEAKGINGIFGSGKTTAIRDQVKTFANEKYIVVGKTRGSVNALKLKDPNMKVYSVEYQSFANESCDILIVDEASLISAWELVLLISEQTKHLFIYGDRHQISPGMYDINVGAVSKSNLLMKCGPGVKVVNHTYRIGSPLLDQLSLALNENLVSKAEHKTTYNVINMEYFDKEKVIEIMRSNDLCLVFYNEHLKELQNYALEFSLHSKVVMISTVESAQGMEASRVAVFQRKCRKGEIHETLQFCISAASRAIHHLTWVNVNTSGKTKELWKLMSIEKIGNWLTGKLFTEQPQQTIVLNNGKSIAGVETEPQELIKEANPVMSEEILLNLLEFYSSNRHTINTCTFDDIDINILQYMIGQKAAKYGATATVSKQENLISIEIKAYIITKWVNIDDKMRFTSNLSQGDHNDMEKTIHNVFGDKTISKIKHNFNLRADILVPKQLHNAIRVLSHLSKIFEFMGEKLSFQYERDEYSITTTKGCSACTGLVITLNKSLKVEIGPDYSMHASRYATDELENFPLFANLLKAKSKESIVIFDNKINLNNPLYSNLIVSERIHSFLKSGVLKMLNGSALMHANEENYKSLIMETELQLNGEFVGSYDGYSEISNWPFVFKSSNESKVLIKLKDKLLQYQQSTESSNKPKPWFTLGESNSEPITLYDRKIIEKLAVIAFYSDMESFKAYSHYSILSRTRNQLIGADSFSALLKPISWHENQKNNSVTDKLRDKMSKLYFSKLKILDRVFYVPTQVHTLLHDVYKLGHRSTPTFGASQADPNVCAADIAVFNMVVNTGENFKYICECPYVSYSCNEKFKVTLPWWESPLSMNQLQATNTLRTMLLVHLENNEHKTAEDATANLETSNLPMSNAEIKDFMELKECKYYTNDTTIYKQPIMIGPSILSLSEQDIQKIAISCAELYFWAPNLEYKNVVHLSNSRLTIPKPRWFKVNGGHTIIDNTKHTLISWKSLSDITIYKLERGHIVYATKQTLRSNKIQVDMPIMFINPGEVIENQSILGAVKTTVDIDIINALQKRLLRPNTSFEDLLVHARTLYHSDRYSSITIHRSILSTAAEAKNCAIIAYLASHTEQEALRLFVTKPNVEKSVTIQTLKDGLINLFTEMFTSLESQLKGGDFDQKQFVNDITDNPHLKDVLINFINELEKIKLISLKPTRSLRMGKTSILNHLAEAYKWFRMPNNSFILNNTTPEKPLEPQEKRICLWFFGTRGDNDFGEIVADHLQYKTLTIIANTDLVSDYKFKFKENNAVSIIDSGISCDDIFRMWRENDLGVLKRLNLKLFSELEPFDDLLTNDFNYIAQYIIKANLLVKFQYIDTSIMHPLGKLAISAFEQYCRLLPKAINATTYEYMSCNVRKVHLEYKTNCTRLDSIRVAPLSKGVTIENSIVVYHKFLSNAALNALRSFGNKKNLVVVSENTIEGLQTVQSVNFNSSKNIILLHHCGIGVTSLILENNIRNVALPVAGDQFNNAKELEFRTNCIRIENEQQICRALEEVELIENENIISYRELDIELEEDYCFKILQHNDYHVIQDSISTLVCKARETLSKRRGFYTTIVDEFRCDEITEVTYTFGMDDNLIWTVGPSTNIYAVCKSPDYNWQSLDINMWLLNVPSTLVAAVFSSIDELGMHYLQEDEVLQKIGVGIYECLECDKPLSENFRSLCPTCTLKLGPMHIGDILEVPMGSTSLSIVDYNCVCGTSTIFETGRKLTLCNCGKLIQRGKTIAKDSLPDLEPNETLKLTNKAFSSMVPENNWRSTLSAVKPRRMIKRIDTTNRVEPLRDYDPFIDATALSNIDERDPLLNLLETHNSNHPPAVSINKVWINSTNDFMTKLTLGRDWLSNDLHFMASVYLDPVKITDSQMRFILSVKSLLNFIPENITKVGVYALEPGMIERNFSEFDEFSIYFSSERLSHLETSKNVLWINTNQSMGRINACLRLLPYLLGPNKQYFMRGGRFGPAGFAIEEFLNYTTEKDVSGTVCMPTAFYMDGAKLTTKPTDTNIMKILSILLNYGSIYGTDEGICYLLPRMTLYHGSTGGYSNVAKALNVDCRLSRWIKSCRHKKLPDIIGPKYKTPLYLLEQAWWDINGFNKAMKLVNPAFIPRDIESSPHKEEETLVSVWKRAIENQNPTSTNYQNSEVLENLNEGEELNGFLPPTTEVEFDPKGTAFCVKECVQYAKSKMDENSEFNKINCSYQRFENVTSTLKKLKLENIKCCVRLKYEHCEEIKFIEGVGKQFGFTLTINKDQQGHMVVNTLSNESIKPQQLNEEASNLDDIYKVFSEFNGLDELFVEMKCIEAYKLLKEFDTITISKLIKIEEESDLGDESIYIIVNSDKSCPSVICKTKGELVSNVKLVGIQFGIKIDLEEEIARSKRRKLELELKLNGMKRGKVEDQFKSTKVNKDNNSGEIQNNPDELERKEIIDFANLEVTLNSEDDISDSKSMGNDSADYKSIISETEKVFLFDNGDIGSLPIIEYDSIKTLKKRGSLKLMDKAMSEETKNSKEKVKKLWRKVKAHIITIDLLTYLASSNMHVEPSNKINENDVEDDFWKEFDRQTKLPPLHYVEMSDELLSLQFRMRSEIFNSLCSMVELPKFLEMENPDHDLLREICRINTIIVFHWKWKEEEYEPMSLTTIQEAVMIEFDRQDLLELGFIEGWRMEDLPIQPSYEFKILKTKPKRKLSKLQFNSIVYMCTLELNLSGYGALPEEPEEIDIGTANPLNWQNIKLGTGKGPDFHFAAEPPTTTWKQSEMQLTKYQLTCLDSLSLLGGKVKKFIQPTTLKGNHNREYETDHYLLDTSLIQNEFCDIPIKLVPQPKTIYVYEDEHGMLETQIPLPAVDIGLRVRQQPVAIKEFTKLKLTEYPEQAVPAYTKHMLSSTKAVSNLFGSKVEYRNYRLVPKNEEEGQRLIDYCYGPGSLDKIASNRKQELWYDMEDLLQWLKQRPDRNKITTELIRVVEEGMAMHPMNIVNIHNKIEARLKDVLLNEQALSEAPTNDIHATKIRQIVWQKKGLTSIFAPVFTRAKQRFKDLLAGGKVLYVDGYTPWQLNKKFNTIPWQENIWFYEDDLTAQDKQTDKISIGFEMWWYVNHLGVSPVLINLWNEAHNHWMGKNHEVRILEDAMRQTGQATTALGNALTNLISKSRTVERYYNSIKLMTILGDDNLIIMDQEPDLSLSVEEAAIYYNMENKPSKSKTGGGFLRMQAYITKEKTIALGPDIVRLRRRFELTNNNSGVDENNLANRAENYKHMLGDVNKVFGEEFPVWYDYQELRKSLSNKYNCTEAEIDNNTALLVDMILTNKAIKFNKLMFATLENKQFKT